jgi:transmembrane sensor
MSDDIRWELLDRYFSGQASTEEAGDLERWVAEQPERADLLQSARAVWQATGVVPRRFDVDAAWATARRRMQVTASAPRALLPARRPFSLMVAAAVALVLAGGGWAVLRSSKQHTPERPPREYVTAPAQRAVFHLRDGTSIQLGVASKLTVPAGYGSGSREVWLEGQAYFEVRHDSASRFLVHTAGAITEDIGTAFVVRAYPGDSAAEVAVRDGKVVLHPGTRVDSGGTLLEPGQVGTTKAGGPVAVLDASDLSPWLGWTEGRLVFRNVPLGEALPQLSRWFDLEFVLSDPSLADRHLTATLEDQPTSDVLNLLAVSLGLKAKRTGARVLLCGGKSPC